MTSRHGFKWPGIGETVSAPDWEATKECGNGLHGWLYGQGDYDTSPYLDETALWLVVEVEMSSVIMLGGKCKFPSAVVRFVGDKKSATDFLIANEPNSANIAVIGATVVVGDKQSALTGAFGTATAGYRGTATAGAFGTVVLRFWDSKAERYRVKVGYIGEDGLLPNVAYHLNDQGEIVPA